MRDDPSEPTAVTHRLEQKAVEDRVELTLLVCSLLHCNKHQLRPTKVAAEAKKVGPTFFAS